MADIDSRDAECLVVLARAGWATVDQIAVAIGAPAYTSLQRRLKRLRDQGLTAKETFPRQHGRHAWAHRLTPRGWRALEPLATSGSLTAQDGYDVAPRHALEHRPESGKFRQVQIRPTWEAARHDRGCTSAAITVASELGERLVDDQGDRPLITWRREVLFEVPRQRRSGRLTRLDVRRVVDGTTYALVDARPSGEAVEPRDLRADALIEVWWPDGRRQDVLLEYDHRAKHEDNVAKFDRYDAFLGGWHLALDRYRDHPPPMLLFVASGDPPGRSRATAACRHALGLRVGLYDETRCVTVGYPARDRVVVASYESIGDRPAAYEEARRHRRRTASPAASFEGWRPHPKPDGHPGRRGDIGDVVHELGFSTPLGGVGSGRSCIYRVKGEPGWPLPPTRSPSTNRS